MIEAAKQRTSSQYTPEGCFGRLKRPTKTSTMTPRCSYAAYARAALIKETVPTVLLVRGVRVGARRQEVQAFPMSDNAQRLSTPLRVGGFHDGVVREECAHLRVGFVTKARGRTTTANTWYLRSKWERGASPVGPTSGVQRQLHGTESALTAGE